MQKIPPTPIKATIYWANLKQPNKMSGKYQVDLGNLSSKAVAALEERGVPIRNKNNEAGDYVTAKSNYPIRAYNADGDEIHCLIGNGSEAVVAVSHYDWKGQTGQDGRSASCYKLVITDLNEYEIDSEVALDLDLYAAL